MTEQDRDRSDDVEDTDDDGLGEDEPSAPFDDRRARDRSASNPHWDDGGAREADGDGGPPQANREQDRVTDASDVDGDGSDGIASDDERLPLEDLADELRSDWRDDLEEVAEDAFIEVEVDKIDRESIWAELEGAAETSFDHTGENEERVIPKRSFCHRCRYFAEPPDMSCTHEGTEIIELVDMDHYRVLDCPIVLEYERTGQTW